MNNEYLTVAEFADRVGITKQAVYKQLNNQLNNQLKQYLKVVDNKKYIHISAVELYLKDNEKSTNSTKVEQPLNNQLNESLTVLQAELKEKNKQIANLNELLNTAHKLIANEQQLHFATKQERDQLQQQAAQLQLQLTTSNDTPQAEQQQQKKSWSLWSWFKK